METIAAIKACDYVITDSGGVQKEAYFLSKKVFVLRKETEWKELITLNSLKLIGNNNLEKIKQSKKFLSSKIKSGNYFGNGSSTKKISLLVKNILTSINEKQNINNWNCRLYRFFIGKISITRWI